MPTRKEVKQLHSELGSWKAVGKALGINPAVAFRYATSDYEPKRQDLRDALGLPRIDYIRQVRNDKGRFA